MPGKVRRGQKLKLYVWEGVTKEHAHGVIVCMAHTITEARAKIRETGAHPGDVNDPIVCQSTFLLIVAH
jgi:hypothetical protein